MVVKHSQKSLLNEPFCLIKQGMMEFGALNVSLCFGLFIDPCARKRGTVNAHIAMKEPDETSFTHNFENNDTVVVPGEKQYFTCIG